ncbi:MAG: M48 family metallopeptidase [Candidatus Hydrogenedentales bacterium]|jgi:heat shock protein HtpX
MWEAIRANKRKSIVLAASMFMLLTALGFFIGVALFAVPMELDAYGQTYPVPLLGGVLGVLAASGVWALLTVIAYFSGGSILMAASGARRIEKQDHPQLFNVVEEMTIASGLGAMPAVYIIDDPALNAFATGRDPQHAAVAITSGLLSRLSRDQLQGVIAHEMGHILNRDILFMQMLGVMAGAIVMISDLYVRGVFYSSGGGRRRSRSSSKGKGNQLQALLLLLGLVFAVLSPLFAQLIYLAASRRREYLADAQSAVLTRYPEGLASALELIERDSQQLARLNRNIAPMFICNPYKRGLSTAGLMRTHPPTAERIRILRTMAGAASFAEYQRASERLGAKANVPPSVRAAEAAAPIRAAQPEAPRAQLHEQRKLQWRQATDALRGVNKFMFLTCACGLRLKLPPDFKKEKVACPRCRRELALPVAALAAARSLGDTLERAAASSPPDSRREPPKAKAPEMLSVKRQPGAWTSFRCPCGQVTNLPPGFEAPTVQCPRCKRSIRIDGAA